MLLATRYAMPLDVAESRVRLGTKSFGRLGIVRAGRPHIVPVNYLSTGDGLYVHDVDGDQLHDTLPGEIVVLGVDDSNDQRAWSVMVKGVAERMTDSDLSRARSLPTWIWTPETPGAFVRIRAVEITGRLYQR